MSKTKSGAETPHTNSAPEPNLPVVLVRDAEMLIGVPRAPSQETFSNFRETAGIRL